MTGGKNRGIIRYDDERKYIMNNATELATAIRNRFGDVKTVSRAQVKEICEMNGMKFPSWFMTEEYRVGRGKYSMEKLTNNSNVPEEVSDSVTNVDMALTLVKDEPVVEPPSTENLIPSKIPGYVNFGNFTDLRSIVKSKKFYPVFITGLSGNGKTMMVEQVCANEKRECIRVNITVETDEDDLMGGFRLVDGKTVWHNGPVITAMMRGAILLLDEVDLGSNKMMCLQPVLEGKPVFLKKINKLIVPAKGFNIVATANTKGKGSDDGRFVGTNVLNEAFLERFSITMEQDYPNARVEQKILNNILEESGCPDAEFVNKLVTWADVIRKSFADGAVSEIISTRRLVHICEAYSIFNKKRNKAIELCLNRFDTDTKTAFLDLYNKLDDQVKDENDKDPYENKNETEEVPF